MAKTPGLGLDQEPRSDPELDVGRSRVVHHYPCTIVFASQRGDPLGNITIIGICVCVLCLLHGVWHLFIRRELVGSFWLDIARQHRRNTKSAYSSSATCFSATDGSPNDRNRRVAVERLTGFRVREVLDRSGNGKTPVRTIQEKMATFGLVSLL